MGSSSCQWASAQWDRERCMKSAPTTTSPHMRKLRWLTDSLGGAALGAMVYAIWAVCVNWHASPSLAIRAGLTHWVISTALTYCDAANMRYFFSLGRTRLEGMAFALCAGLTLTYSVLITAHLIVGTPHILLTLAVGVIPNIVYCVGYTLLLSRTTHKPTSRLDARATRKDTSPSEGI
jgi:hypothetical protein